MMTYATKIGLGWYHLLYNPCFMLPFLECTDGGLGVIFEAV